MLLRTWQSIVIAVIINRRMQYDRLSQQQLGFLFSNIVHSQWTVICYLLKHWRESNIRGYHILDASLWFVAGKPDIKCVFTTIHIGIQYTYWFLKVMPEFPNFYMGND